MLSSTGTNETHHAFDNRGDTTMLRSPTQKRFAAVSRGTVGVDFYRGSTAMTVASWKAIPANGCGGAAAGPRPA